MDEEKCALCGHGFVSGAYGFMDNKVDKWNSAHKQCVQLLYTKIKEENEK